MGQLPARMNRIKAWVKSGLNVQFLTTTLSLPILIAWGLPISLMTVVGNLCALPFLVATLTLSSLLFLTELIGLPNALIAQATNLIIEIWHFFIKQGSPSWLVGYHAPPFFISIILVTAVPIALMYLLNRLKFSIIPACITTTAGYIFIVYMFHAPILHQESNLHCIARNKSRSVIDTGFFKNKTNYASPAKYKIKPLLYKFFGDNHINRWHSHHGGVRSLRGITALLEEIKIDTISFGTLPSKPHATWLNTWQLLQAAAKKHKTVLQIREPKIKNLINS